MTYYHLTKKSTNRKTGPMPIVTSSQRTCPDNCPFKRTNNGGCYANGGPLRLHWDKITRGERGVEFAGLLKILREIPRWQTVK